MQKLRRIMRTGLLYGLAVLLAGGYPLTALAESPPPTYTYNADTNHWDTDKWQYDSTSGTYKPKPAPAVQGPVSDSIIGPTDQRPNGPQGTQPAVPIADSAATTTASTNTQVQNNLDSTAITGNATVGSNTSAGSATTGNAAASTTIINTVQSTVSGDTTGVAHFTADVYGNVTGDITLAPALSSVMSGSQPNDSSLQVTNSTSLTNNVALKAGTGDASVTNNTSAGSATTGNANAVANIVNLINSIIAANKSFVGTINIYGNLNGDILISPEFIPQLLASNGGGGGSSTTNATLTDNQSIINNINLGAATGTATVADNTSAGSATTGKAQTNLTVLNLSGHTVVAKNSLLVFVNVLGTWIGIIVDAPVGTTAAMLGNGVTTNGDSSQTINATNNSTITNNVDLSAVSGNATVAGNTSAGSATTGNATASANIANITNSEFGLSDWFGVLFINVLGSWHGSFGVNTSDGDSPVISTPTVQGTTQIQAPLIQFGFVPRQSPSSSAGSATTVLNSTAATEVASITSVDTQGNVLGDNTSPESQQATQAALLSPAFIAFMIIGFIGVVITAIYGLSVRRQ